MKKPLNKSEVVKESGAYDADGVRHFRWTCGITSIEVMPIGSSKWGPLTDVEFSDLIDTSLTDVILSCMCGLRHHGYFASCAMEMGERDDVPFAQPRGWLSFEAIGKDGKPVLEPLRESGYEDIPDPTGYQEKMVPAIAVAARLIWEDEAARGNIFSEIWFLAKILEVWFWPGGMKVDSAVLMGQLYTEMNLKLLFEENAVRGGKFKSSGLKAEQGSEQASANASVRRVLVEREFRKMTLAELDECRTKSGSNAGRLQAIKVARRLQNKQPFKDRRVGGMELEAIANVVRRLLKK